MWLEEGPVSFGQPNKRMYKIEQQRVTEPLLSQDIFKLNWPCLSQAYKQECGTAATLE